MRFSAFKIHTAKYFYLYKGEKRSIKSLSKEFGIPRRTIEYRLSKKWSVEKAVETPLRQTKKYLYKDKMYTATELAHIANVDRNTVLYRMNERGMTVEEAVDTPSAHHGDGFPTVASMHKKRKSNPDAYRMYATVYGRCNAK